MKYPFMIVTAEKYTEAGDKLATSDGVGFNSTLDKATARTLELEGSHVIVDRRMPIKAAVINGVELRPV